MSPFDALAGTVVSTVQSVFGSTSSFVYSRPQSTSFDAIAPFSISAALNSGGEYATPEGSYSGALLVKVADIPLGPQRGDLVTIAAPPVGMNAGKYEVQRIVKDAAPGWASLDLRWMRQ